MRFNRFLIVLISISLLPACVAANTNKENSNQTETSTIQFSPIAHAATAELLDFIAQFPSLSPAQQELVYQDTIKGLITNQNDNKLLIKKAAMLALPNSKVRNTKDALTLLNTLLSANDLNSSDTNLAKLLQIYTLENSVLTENADNYTKLNSTLKQKNKALEQKLNDLKNIEKTMIERNTKAP
jgi:hypothetical protein